jgi:hypothetical protein
MKPLLSRTRFAKIIAQDPGVRVGDKVLMAEVEIPAERLADGPRGHRLSVIDYDASTDKLHRPFKPPQEGHDAFANIEFDEIIANPGFHAWNAYAVTMRTLGRFEFALGRKVGWNQPGHQLKIFPHAFQDANAFYAAEAEALMFGYFRGEQNNIFSCLAHDIIAHETTHAVIDGLRTSFSDPSSPDQAAFHEGFADVVALLEVLSLPEVVQAILEHNWAKTNDQPESKDTVKDSELDERKLLETELFGLAVEMGQELAAGRGNALRRSVTLQPLTTWSGEDEWKEPHRRGEILSAVMLRAFVKVWMQRISRLRRQSSGQYDIGSVAEEGAAAADHLLTTAMRAIDYTPPIHLTFSDFRTALLTADFELRPRIDRYKFRDKLGESFDEFGVSAAPDSGDDGQWERGNGDSEPRFDYDRSRYEGMQRDVDEVFRFIWENSEGLGLVDDAYTQVTSIRPAVRVAPEDGAIVRETVVEVGQQIQLLAHELGYFGVKQPPDMDANQPIVLRGGATLIFDDYGRLKYRIRNALPLPKSNPKHDQRVAMLHTARLEHLWRSGYLDEQGGGLGAQRLRELHLRKAIDDDVTPKELW